MAGHLFIASASALWPSLLALLLEALAVMGSPGPSTMAVMATAAAFGVRQSLRFVSGAIAGTVAVLLAVAAGVMALLSSVPGLGASLTLGSTAYILYLAWKIATAPPLAKQTADAGAPSFIAGFLLAIANPKAWFAIAAVFMGSTLLQSSRLGDASLKAIVLAGMIVVIHFTWLLGGASLAGVLGDPPRSRIANLVFALLLVATTMRALIG